MIDTNLQNAARQLGASYAQLGIYENNAESRIFTHGIAGQRESVAHKLHPVMCSIKLFTATLVTMLAPACQVDFSSNLPDLAERFGAPWLSVYGALTLGQLLSHSHGLAASCLSPADPLTLVFDENDRPGPRDKLFEPGRYYSYGSVGYTIVGQLIAAMCGNRFEQVLYDVLLENTVSENTKQHYREHVLTAQQKLGPAGSHDLKISIADLLAFTRLFTDAHARIPALSPERISALLQPVISMPGWAPYLKASCAGFRDFGDGWYGHNGADKNNLTYIRINPVKKAAICLIAGSDKDNLAMLPSMVLKDDFPELVPAVGDLPKLVTEKQYDQNHPVLGSFSDSQTIYRTSLHNGRVKFEIFDETGGVPSSSKQHSCYLYPAEQEIYFLSRPGKKVSYVQLVVDERNSQSYLWDCDQMRPKQTGSKT